MQEVEGFINGTFNYYELKGDTGPLVLVTKLHSKNVMFLSQESNSALFCGQLSSRLRVHILRPVRDHQPRCQHQAGPVHLHRPVPSLHRLRIRHLQGNQASATDRLLPHVPNLAPHPLHLCSQTLQ